MTVTELIEYLKQQDQDAIVVVPVDTDWRSQSVGSAQVENNFTPRMFDNKKYLQINLDRVNILPYVQLERTKIMPSEEAIETAEWITKGLGIKDRNFDEVVADKIDSHTIKKLRVTVL